VPVMMMMMMMMMMIMKLFYHKNNRNQTRLLTTSNLQFFVRFEVFATVTMKNGVFWDVTPCGSCKNRRFGVT
jgi:hypothetical protein